MKITSEIIHAIETNEEWQRKMPRQFELEEKMRNMGIDRYWSRTSRAVENHTETNTIPVKRLMNQALSDVAAGIEAFVAQAYSGKAGVKAVAVRYIEQLDAEAAALITVRTVLDGVTKGDTTVALARRVGSMIMDEVQFRQFKEQNGEDYKSLKQKYEKQTGHYRHKRNAMRHHMDAKGIQIEDWPVTDIVMVGAKCIDIMIETTGLVEQVTRAVDVKRHEPVIIATEAAMQWINEEHNRCAALSPVLLPTIVPPRPWTGPREGGYWTNRVRGMNVVKTFSRATSRSWLTTRCLMCTMP